MGVLGIGIVRVIFVAAGFAVLASGGVAATRLSRERGRVQLLDRTGPAQPDAVPGIEDPHPRVGRPDARQPGVLQGQPDTHIEVRIRQGRHLTRRGIVGVRVLTGPHHGLNPDLVAADPLHEGRERDHGREDRQGCLSRLGSAQRGPRPKGDAAQEQEA